MFNIVYYYIPIEHLALTKDQKELYDMNLQDWVGMIITDSHAIYENKKWYEVDFFTTQTTEVAKLLWNIKGEQSKLSIKKKRYRFKKEYTVETIESENSLVAKLDELGLRNYGYVFLYTRDGEVQVAIYSDGCEVLYLLMKKENMIEVEEVISAVANKVDFFLYELGQD